MRTPQVIRRNAHGKKGYVRKAHVKRMPSGRLVRVKPTQVKAANPTKRGNAGKTGKNRWIKREGKLGGKGYLSKTSAERQSLLRGYLPTSYYSPYYTYGLGFYDPYPYGAYYRSRSSIYGSCSCNEGVVRDACRNGYAVCTPQGDCICYQPYSQTAGCGDFKGETCY